MPHTRSVWATYPTVWARLQHHTGVFKVLDDDAQRHIGRACDPLLACLQSHTLFTVFDMLTPCRIFLVCIIQFRTLTTHCRWPVFHISHPADVTAKDLGPNPVVEHTQPLLHGELRINLIALPQHACLKAKQGAHKWRIHHSFVLANISQRTLVEVPVDAGTSSTGGLHLCTY